ncbi:uncharacterized protein LOC130635478 [Hydractinia symbiolongicarpus]|uniref:uncharacterized protein LOC130635478 n=1 Tax=Hydractinia symbiolongicarpus TaxID=13093 RepID=UPI00254F69DA|nr:uncharacterized protein LOC130635478 [Hydractinia symbiolongicarpus]
MKRYVLTVIFFYGLVRFAADTYFVFMNSHWITYDISSKKGFNESQSLTYGIFQHCHGQACKWIEKHEGIKQKHTTSLQGLWIVIFVIKSITVFIQAAAIFYLSFFETCLWLSAVSYILDGILSSVTVVLFLNEEWLTRLPFTTSYATYYCIVTTAVTLVIFVTLLAYLLKRWQRHENNDNQNGNGIQLQIVQDR